MKRVTPLSGFTPPHLLSHTAESTPILVALSGGADSVALLALLIDYAEKTGAPLSVAHVNHKLRGADADADADFCRALAERYQLPFYLLEVDVRGLAVENKRGIEEQARISRYEFFASLMAKHKIPLLATAHHADDNAETLLLHITRGSGLHGLGGIAPVRDFASGKLIRPLLSVAKADILAFCEANGLSFVTDSTNEDVDYARNRIRHNVMPELCRINPSAVDSITRLCRTAAREDDFIAACAHEFLETNKTNNGALPLEALCNAHPALAARAVKQLLSSRLSDTSATHVASVLKLAEDGVPHSSLDLGSGVRAYVEAGCLWVSDTPVDSTTPPNFCTPLREGENPIPEADMLILVETESSRKNHEAFKNIYKKATTTHISSATIYDSLVARPRREGDVILTHGMHKKVKKLMCDCGLPLTLRPRLPIVCDADGILWIPFVAQRDGSVGDGNITVTLFYND